MMEPNEEEVVPFSNGTEAMRYYEHNCDRCVKAWFPRDYDNWPKEETMRRYVKEGRYCKFQWHIDYGFITGVIPESTAVSIGIKPDHSFDCRFFSDDNDDRWHPHKRPKYPPANQLDLFTVPFLNVKRPHQEIEKVS